MIFRIDGKLITISRTSFRNDVEYYTEIYKLLAKTSNNNAKLNPTNKILSAMFIE